MGVGEIFIISVIVATIFIFVIAFMIFNQYKKNKGIFARLRRYISSPPNVMSSEDVKEYKQPEKNVKKF